MTKKFCDICGDPAEELKHGSALGHPVCDPFIAYHDGAERMLQTKITVSIRFGFEQHPKGFGGPPDLCHKCAVKLATEAAKRVTISEVKP